MRHLRAGGPVTAAALTALALAAAAACSTSPPGGEEGGAGPGVTAKTIKLGYLTDLSGAISGQGRVDLAGSRMYLDRLNAAGGICGRKVELAVEDHGYDVQKAISLYRKTTPDVLGYLSLLGSPQFEALKSKIQNDDVVTGILGWDSNSLTSPDVLVYGTPYDLETISGIGYLVDQKILRKGDSLGHIYWQGSYGENALRGAKFAAQKYGLKLVPVQVDPAESDLTRQVRGLQSQKVKAIMLSTLPTQAASVASVTSSSGWRVPILGNSATFLPQLLKTPSADALQKQFYLVSSRLPFGTDNKVAKDIQQEFEKAEPQGIKGGEDGINVGWAAAQVYTEVVKKACASGGLTRESMEKALRASSAIDTGGLLPTLDYSKVGLAPSKSVYVSRPDAKQPGGLKLLTKELYTAKEAAAYQTPGQSNGG
ncbi:ABC transporter substrate-binding protein [Actinomadura darangshiensis]|uniref:ABC transporter substrate-binding protein n=1 Tax=Actinomadura darangshiensis TaxID=705336 RepID=A0A4R5BUU1_9ACTN|nr:ABC transporter substrate-binding protein [Actinomadura darangshiensis]TDD87974.1 ABC transporter substrate-binding protein [Actinomadura darangshiensis]